MGLKISFIAEIKSRFIEMIDFSSETMKASNQV